MKLRTHHVSVAFAVLGFVLAGCAAQTSVPEAKGWTTLIDGETGLDNWNRAGDANWRAADGAIQADRKIGKGYAYLVSKEPYADFQIHAEFWVSDDANTGIFLRCAKPRAPTPEDCYEVNIFDQRPDPTYGTGAIVDIAPASQPLPKAGGKWNTLDITAQGAHLSAALNGRVTADARNDKLKRGPIALQYDRGVVKFRKLEIKPLP